MANGGRHAWWLLGLAVLLSLPALSGCHNAIVGHWTLVEAEPNREVFSIDNAEFRSDGTFTATTTIEGLTSTEKGTYSFNGFKLKLQPQAGGQRAYLANVKFGELRIAEGERKVTLNKAK